MKDIRVRFAPSPTGGLHIGGVRTALFNYLFAKKMGGTFILRIEDTDQARFVEGAEAYIIEALKWCEINPQEGPEIGGPYGPYRQSERKVIYQKYAQQLIDEGKAYYAFDSSEDLEQMREKLKADGVLNLNYNSASRRAMKNSLTLSAQEVKEKLDTGVPYVVRFKMPDKREIRFHDLIRGWILVHSSTLDDKVILKSDGLATYHLANVVDDYLMKISHVIRGEEWLPSAPLHVLLYEAFNWTKNMPDFAHLPLIMKSDGNGKLSKRAAEKAGFPIFPLTWKESNSQEVIEGFRELGFFPEALVNFLALLGWNPGGDREIFNIEELSEVFSIDRIGKSGTKFDFEKAKWFNQHYLKNKSLEELSKGVVEDLLIAHRITCQPALANQIVALLIQRVTYANELAPSSLFLFNRPDQFDEFLIHKKWNQEAALALSTYSERLIDLKDIDAELAHSLLQETMQALGINPGRVLQTLRIAITGCGSGPDLMKIIEILGTTETVVRIRESILKFEVIKNSNPYV